MIGKCAEMIADWLVNSEVIEKTDKELYSYAVQSFFMSVLPLMLAIVFGRCMGCVLRSAMIVIPFIFIRKFSGGYHAKHAWVCFICSCLLLFLCIVVSFYIRSGWLLAILTIGAVVSLICFSPIEHVNRELSPKEHKLYKKIAVILVEVFLIIDVLFFVCRLYTYSVCISIGILLTAGLQLPCILGKIYKNSVKKTKRD